jgi:hypothetical protein
VAEEVVWVRVPPSGYFSFLERRSRVVLEPRDNVYVVEKRTHRFLGQGRYVGETEEVYIVKLPIVRNFHGASWEPHVFEKSKYGLVKESA